MSNKLVRKLGVEKLSDFKERFDEVVDKYREIAKSTGYEGELVFKKERGMMIVFVKL
tara:strand:- start:531 stop:701 length:171 start_codon:yes stop_codon:yes gene_type:complete